MTLLSFPQIKLSFMLLLLSFFSLSFINLSHAEKITNITLQANENNLYISWDKLSDDDFGNSLGYAVQWSDRQDLVAIDEHARLYQGTTPQVFSDSGSKMTLSLARFDRNLTQYLRVYTYNTDDEGKKNLGNGSDRITWKVDYYDVIETSSTVITDPVIVSNSIDSTAALADLDMGSLRVSRYDTFADFAWSKPALAIDSDYDGYIIKMGTSSDLSNDDTTKITLGRATTQIRVTGLDPSTQYYAQGYLYKNSGGEDKTFGNTEQKDFMTIDLIPRDSSTRASRNLIKIETKAILKFTLDGESQTTSTTTTSTSSTAETNTAINNTTTASTTTSTSTSSTTSASSSSSSSSLAVRIAALKREISSLQTELAALEKEAGVSSTTSSYSNSSYSNSSYSTPNYSTTSTKTSSTGLTVQERLRAIRAAKNK